MRRLWASIPFSTEFVVATTEQEAFRAAEKLGLPLMFKPDRSFGGSRGVSRVEHRGQIGEAFEFAVTSGLPGTSVVIERSVSGSEHSCEVLIADGETSVLCIGQKVKSPAPYRVDMSVQYPAPLSEAQENTIANMCRLAVSALGLTRGVAHVEFAYTADGPVLFELGARCGGGHTPQVAHAVTGVNEFIVACEMACGDPPSTLAALYKRGADYRFLIFPPGRIRSVYLPERVRNHPDVLDVEVLAKPGDEIHSVQTTSERAGFVVTSGDDRLKAAALADWACHQISLEYSDGAVSSPCGVYSRASEISETP